jgi:Cu/Ag efflux protein CusF
MVRSRFIALTFVLAAFVLVGAFGTAALAQKPLTKGASVTTTATIEAIDSTARLVTLKDQDGSYSTIYAGPDVQRFSELKVGQKVTFTYYESLVLAIQKPGAVVTASGEPTVARSKGATPGGTISQQVTATVTVNAVDIKVPSITVTTEDGRKMSFKAQDAKNLEGVKAGDKIQITYTQALAISVK